MFRIHEAGDVDPHDSPTRTPAVRAGSFYGAVCLCGVLTMALALLLVPHGARGLSGRIGAGARASIGVHADQSGDFSGWLANHSGATVTLESATMLPARGLHSPQFVGATVATGRSFFGAARGWPAAGEHRAGAGLVALRGFRLRNGQRARILYAIRAARDGNYAAGGVAVTVHSAAGTTVVRVLSLGGICVAATPKPRCGRAFRQRLHQASA